MFLPLNIDDRIGWKEQSPFFSYLQNHIFFSSLEYLRESSEETEKLSDSKLELKKRELNLLSFQFSITSKERIEKFDKK